MNDLSGIGVLAVLIFVVALITAPQKGDSEITKTMRRIGRYTLTATLLCAVGMGLFALWVTHVH